MKLTLQPFNLPREHVFTISRGSKSVQPCLVVELSENGVSGFGEAPDEPFYGQTLASITDALRCVESFLSDYPFEMPEELWEALSTKLDGNSFALSALDIAAHDLAGRMAGKPLHQMWNLPWENVPDSSYTIGIDRIESMVAKLKMRPDWPFYKIKLGTGNDVEIVRELRKHTDAVFRVDANCAWTANETIEISRALAELNVEFIEQPLRRDASRADHLRVFEESVLPVLADENCLVEADVDRCHGLFHGINVKLCKCGGLTPSLRMLRHARSLGMKTMLGCMVESSVGISAAAHLAPLLDYADLDGAELIATDPAKGVKVANGSIQLVDAPGSGAELVPTVAAQLAG